MQVVKGEGRRARRGRSPRWATSPARLHRRRLRSRAQYQVDPASSRRSTRRTPWPSPPASRRWPTPGSCRRPTRRAPPRASASPRRYASARAAARTARWQLRREHRDETGVIFAASFVRVGLARRRTGARDGTRRARRPARRRQSRVGRRRSRRLDPRRRRDDAERWLAEQEPSSPPLSPSGTSTCRRRRRRTAARTRRRPREAASRPATAASASGGAASAHRVRRRVVGVGGVVGGGGDLRVQPQAALPPVGDGCSQLAELIQARGPNLHVNRRVRGDDGGGSCSPRTGSASAEPPRRRHLGFDNPPPTIDVPNRYRLPRAGRRHHQADRGEAALPFDKRRNGMILGAGRWGSC